MIELIIVIAIIGIFTAVASLSLDYLKAGNVRSAAKTVDSNLSKLKLDTMSREEKTYMHIYKRGDNYYMYCTTEKDPSLDSNPGVKIGNASVAIYVDNKKLEQNQKCILSYKKGSGTFRDQSDDSSLPKLPKEIVFKRSDGTGNSYTLKIVKETGKHYIEK